MLSDQDDWVNILSYGEPGTGKTTAQAHMAKLGRVVYINAESGAKRRALAQFDIPLDRIEVFPAKGQIISFESLDDLFWELKDDVPVGVVFDSVTEVHKLLLEQVTAREVEKTRRKQERAGLEPDVDPFFIDRSYYGVMTEQMRQLIRKYRDLPCHTAFTALPRRDQNDKTGEVTYGPALTPALATDLMGYVDLICHHTIEDGLYCGTFVAKGIKVAKDRYRCLPPVLVNPTMDRIVAYIREELQAETDPEQKRLPQGQQKGRDR
jgi:hypothetical protein